MRRSRATTEAAALDRLDLAVLALEQHGDLAVASGDAVGDEVGDMHAALERGLEGGEGAATGERGSWARSSAMAARYPNAPAATTGARRRTAVVDRPMAASDGGP